MTTTTQILLTCILLCTLLGCAEPSDPSHYPRILELERSMLVKHHPIDLDGDGRDELMMLAPREVANAYDQGGYVGFKTLEGNVIDQHNFAASQVLEPFVLDWDDDGLPEALAPFVRNDSLFIQVLKVSLTGQKVEMINEVFLTSGSARERDGQIHKWDPYIRQPLRWENSTEQGTELITYVNTGLAGTPRGVFRHALPGGEPLNVFLNGVTMNYQELDDVDGDGNPEFVVSAPATDNEVSVNGFSDDIAYIMVFKLDPLSILWRKKVGHSLAYPHMKLADINEDGRNEYILGVFTNDASKEGHTINLVDPVNGTFSMEFELEAPYRNGVVLNLDDDPADEVLIMDINGNVYILGEEFFPTSKVAVASQGKDIMTIPDADGDNVNEVIVRTENAYLFLTPELRVKAIYESTKAMTWGTINTGVDTQPYVYGVEDGYTKMFILVKNQFFWWHLYNNKIGWALVCILLIMTLRSGTKNRSLSRQVVEKSHIEQEYTLFKQVVEKEQTQLKKEQARLVQDAALLNDKDARIKQLYAGCTFRSVEGPDLPDFLVKVRAILDKHASNEDFSVTELAEIVEDSDRTLQRKLSQLTGMSPSELIRQYRIHRFAELLQDPRNKDTISEIAYSTGFKDVPLMNRHFKKAFDKTPTEYRNSFR